MPDRALPILFVPGVLGTTLVDVAARRQMWGSAAGLFASRRLPVSIDGMPGVEPGEVLWRFVVIPRLIGVRVYETLARVLERAGYRRASLDDPTRRNGLYGLAYDWRQDVVAAARSVDAAIERLRSTLGVSQVHVVAHSWGCNVVRYFIRYGSTDVMATPQAEVSPGADRVAAFFALGPLYGGTWRALHEAQHGFGVALGLGVKPHQTSTTPSLYQLLPYDTALAVREDGTAASTNLSDAGTWRALHWGAFHPRITRRIDPDALETRIGEYLARGARLWHVLEKLSPVDRSVPTVTYTVDDQPTLSRLVIDADGRPLTSLEDIRRKAPHLLDLVSAQGDSYVPYEQVRRHCAGTEIIAVGGCTHRDLYKHKRVLSHLAEFAGAAA